MANDPTYQVSPAGEGDGHLSPNDTNKQDDNAMDHTPIKKGFRFWAIIGALAVTGLLTALEATITSTALPTIIEALGGASLYVWVINLYFLTMYATTPTLSSKEASS